MNLCRNKEKGWLPKIITIIINILLNTVKYLLGVEYKTNKIYKSFSKQEIIRFKKIYLHENFKITDSSFLFLILLRYQH